MTGAHPGDRWRPAARLNVVGRLRARLADLDERLGALEREVREVRLLSDATQEALLLAEASARLPKRPVVLLVEAEDDYGNLAALGAVLRGVLGDDGVAILARDECSEHRWRAEGLAAHRWTTAPGVGAAPVWELALRAAVSVYEHHDWWRAPDRLVLRGLLAGSAKVQLWHGSTGPLGKDVALSSAVRATGMREFADVVTTSTGFRYLVCEPRSVAKRRGEIAFAEHVADVDFRMRRPLGAPPREGPLRVLVAPTYPEGGDGAARLADRLAAYREVASASDAEVWIRHHAWTPQWVTAASEGLEVLGRDVDLYAVLADFDVLVTDFSSVSADMLLLGRRVVLDVSDADAYGAGRTIRRNETMLALCDLARGPREALRLAVTPATDSRAAARRADADARLAAVGAVPGENTLGLLAGLVAGTR